MKKASQQLKRSDALKRLGYRPGQRVELKRERAAIVPIEDLERLEQLEDRLDVELSKKALKEEDGIPLEELAADLGL